jgi:hypothetical protein
MENQSLPKFPLPMLLTFLHPPQSVMLGDNYGSDWLRVKYSAPRYDGGAPITMYRLEWDTSPMCDSLVAMEFELFKSSQKFKRS